MRQRREVSIQKRMGARVEELRKRRRYATRSGMARTMHSRSPNSAIALKRLGKIERGESEMTAMELYRLSNFLNYPLSEFYAQPYGQVPRTRRQDQGTA